MESMLTTIDNPYDPFTQFDEWYTYDEAKGYHTCSLLGLATRTSDELSDEDYHQEIEKAIDFILEINASGMHKKVTREV